ncbi:MAG: helix-turn-helix domain-containing protein [Pirellulaceae bacterium]
MSTSYIPLEQAAAQLGISVEQLTALQSQGTIRGFKDGATWKFDQAEIDRILAERESGLSDDGSTINVFGGGVSVSSDEDNLSDDSASGLAILKDGIDSSSGSSLEMLGSFGESDENLLADVSTDSSASPLAPDDKIDASSGSRSDLISDLSHSGEDLVLNIDSESSASLLSFDQSNEDALADLASQSDVLSFDEAQTAGDESASSPVLESDKVSPNASDDSIQLTSGSESNLDVLHISDSADDGFAIEDSQGDVDLSLDLSLDDDDAPSDPIDVDLSLAEKALSDSLDIDLSSSEPSSVGSDLGMEPDDSVGLGSDPSPSQSEVSLSAVGDIAQPSVTPVSDIQLSSPANSDLEELDDLDDLISDGSGSAVMSGSDPVTPVSSVGSGLLIDDDDDDMVLGGQDDDDALLDQVGSDISVIGGSGINLMSPSDSGLSLESEPLDLAGSSISSIDLSNDVSSGGSGSQPGSRVGSSGSLVDFKADEEFQLSPSGIGLEADDDSASQVIEVEDSEAVALDSGGADLGWDQAGIVEADDIEDEQVGGMMGQPIDDDDHEIDTSSQSVAAAPAAYEVPFTVLNVFSLAGILLMLSACGVVSADLMRNIWSDGSASASVSSLSATLLKALGMDG